MAKILDGERVARKIEAESAALVQELGSRGIQPCIASMRVGENPDDIWYQESLQRWAGRIGLASRAFTLPESAGSQALIEKLQALSADESIHGILLFCPLPPGFDEAAAREAIAPAKDVDSLTRANSAAVFMGDERGFAPCTPQAVVEILKYYAIPLSGSRTVIIGRSQVVGKPLAMLLLKEDATITICHSKSRNLPGLCREAEILIAALGKANFIQKEHLRPGQVVIDVGINMNPECPGRICGDVAFKQAEEIVAALTPVPGGVGAVTSAILCRHTVEACMRQQG